LKYFCEKKNEYHLATAGSLLGVKLTKGFPVGKVNFLDLAPLNFFEFLHAFGESKLAVMLEEIESPKAISEIFHNKLTTLLKYYFIIGGMPEAVATYLKTENLEQVRVVQKEILDAYVLDFAKHAPKDEVMKIIAVWVYLHSVIEPIRNDFLPAKFPLLRCAERRPKISDSFSPYRYPQILVEYQSLLSACLLERLSSADHLNKET